MCVILILTFFPDKLLVLNAFKEWFVKSKILTNQMSCWNISRKSYLGLKSVFSRVRRNTTSLQPFICILMKSGVIPGIPQRFTSRSCSATHWPQGWVGSWFADLAPVTPDCWWGIHRVSNIKPLWTQCYWSFTIHPIRRPFKQHLLSLLCKYSALTKLYYNLSTRVLHLQQTPTSKSDWRWSNCKNVQRAFSASTTWLSSEMGSLQH